MRNPNTLRSKFKLVCSPALEEVAQRARVVGPHDRLGAAQRRGDEGLRAVEVAALLQDQPEIVLGRRLSSRQRSSHTSQPRKRG